MYNAAKKPSTYTIIIYARLFHSLRFGPKAYSLEGKQTVVSVFCPINAEFTHHDLDKISPYDK